MKNIFLKILLAILAALTIQSLLVLVQYFYGSSNLKMDFFTKLGFPYKFYYFSSGFEIHGFILKHFIYDAFVSFLFSFLLILIISKMRNKRKKGSGTVNLINKTTDQDESKVD